MTSCPYTVAGLKSFIGRQGHGFNATLLRDGRKVAFVTDHANGGCFSIDWLAKDRAKAEADARALRDYCASLPAWSAKSEGLGDDTTEFSADEDHVIAKLVERLENERLLARRLKKKVLFIDPANTGPAGGVRAFTCAPTPANLAAIAAKYPGYQVLNTLPPQQAAALYFGAAQ